MCRLLCVGCYFVDLEWFLIVICEPFLPTNILWYLLTPSPKYGHKRLYIINVIFVLHFVFFLIPKLGELKKYLFIFYLLFYSSSRLKSLLKMLSQLFSFFSTQVSVLLLQECEYFFHPSFAINSIQELYFEHTVLVLRHQSNVKRFEFQR